MLDKTEAFGAQERQETPHKTSKFAKLPLAATEDPRLTKLHVKALGRINWHCHKHGKCWAKLQTMADAIGCNPTNLSTAIRELVEFGYLTRERATGKDKRCFVLRVRNDPNNFAHGQTISQTSLPTGKLSPQPDRRNGFDHQRVNGHAEPRNREYEILRGIENLKGPAERGESEICKQLAIFERLLEKRREEGATEEGNEEKYRGAIQFCKQVFESLDSSKTSSGFAYRLLQQYGPPEPSEPTITAVSSASRCSRSKYGKRNFGQPTRGEIIIATLREVAAEMDEAAE